MRPPYDHIRPITPKADWREWGALIFVCCIIAFVVVFGLHQCAESDAYGGAIRGK